MREFAGTYAVVERLDQAQEVLFILTEAVQPDHQWVVFGFVVTGGEVDVEVAFFAQSGGIQPPVDAMVVGVVQDLPGQLAIESFDFIARQQSQGTNAAELGFSEPLNTQK